MYRSTVTLIALAIFLAAVPAEVAEAFSKRSGSRFSLRHRSQLELRLGIRDDAHFDGDYYVGGVATRNSIGDMMVAFGFNFWADERTAFTLTARVLASETEDVIDWTHVYNTEFAVVPIFIGFRQYLGRHVHHSPVRPYLAFGGGPVIGTQRLWIAGVEVLSETRTISAAGAHIGGGVDFIAGRHFMFGMNAGYNLLSDFDEPIGGHVNYSGAEFAVGFGVLF